MSEQEQIIDTGFFKHLFFDAYMVKEEGNVGYIPAEIFTYFLKKYHPNTEFSNNFYTTFFQQFNHFDSTNYSVTYGNEYNELIKGMIIRNEGPSDCFLLLSGWTNQKGGHAINIYFEKVTEDLFNVYVINSGAGLENHDDIVGTKNNIVIGFNNINLESVKVIIKFSYILKNYDLRVKIKQFMDMDLASRIRNSAVKPEMYDIYSIHFSIFQDIDIDSDFFYKFINQYLQKTNLFRNIQDIPQLSGSCTYFSHYYFLKNFIFKNDIIFNKFIEDVKIDIINFISINLEYLNYHILKIKDQNTDQITKTNTYNINLNNILNLLIKDYNSILSPLIKNTIISFMLKNYNKIYTHELIKSPNNSRNDNGIINIFNRIKYHCANPNNFELIIYNLNLLIDTIHNKLESDLDEYNSILYYYILCRISVYFFIYSNKNNKSYNLLDTSETFKSINNIFYNINLIEGNNSMNFSRERYLPSHSSFSNISCLLIYSILNIISNDFPINQLRNKLGLYDLAKINEVIDKQLYINLQSYIDIDLEDFKRKIKKNLGLFLNYRLTDYNPLIEYIFKIRFDRDVDSIQYPKNNPNTKDNISYESNINNFATIDYNINQLNNNNFNELTNIFFSSEVLLDKFRFNFSQSQNNYFDEELDSDNLYRHNINSNQYNYPILFSDNNNNFKILQSLALKINIDNFFNNIKMLNINFIDSILFLLYRFRYDEIKDTYLKCLDELLPNSISKYMYNSNINKNNLPFISLLCIVNYEKNDELNKIYSLYNLSNPINNYEIKRKILGTFFNIKDTNYDNIFFNQFRHISNLNESINLPNYNLFNIEQIRLDVNFYDYICYIKDGNKYYYNSKFKYLTPVAIMPIPGDVISSIFKTINKEVYKLISICPPKIIDLYNKLNNISKIYIWTNHLENTFIFELINFDNIHFKCTYNQSDDDYNITFFNVYDEILSFNNETKLFEHSDVIKKEYNVVFDKSLNYHNYFYGLWCHGAINHFILLDKSDNSSNLLILFSKEYIKTISFFSYWNKKQNPINISNKHYILKLNNTLLNFDIQPSLYIPLFNSLVIAKNNLAIYLILNTTTNIIRKLKSEKNNSEDLHIFDFLINDKADIPNYFLFISKLKGEATDELTKRIGIFTYDTKKLYSPTNINITPLNNKQLNEICKLSDNLIFLKEKITKEKIDIIQENKILSNFIDNYRGNCIKESLCNVQIDNLSQELDDILIKEDIMKYMIETNNFLISNILITFKDYFYQKLINNYFNNIYNEINKKKDICSCFIIHKAIELLDLNIIYNFDKIRTIEDILFEITSGYFIRSEQKNLLYKGKQPDNKIIDDLKLSTSNKIYEILMGRGKTATITPMILLNNYYTKDLVTPQKISYYVVLPNHLTNSSFDILVKYSELFSDFFINTFKLDDNNNITDKSKLQNYDQLNIISDEDIKNYVLKEIINNQLHYFLFSYKNLFIFDEIDSLIDPLKSNLNIPIDNIDHDHKDFIFENVFVIISNYFYNNKGSNNYGINNISDDTPLKISFKNKMTYILDILQNQIFNQTFGYGDTPYKLDELLTNKTTKYKYLFTAIPYSANNSPINSSEFTDFELLLSLTILSYYNTRLRDIDLLLYLNTVRNIYSKNQELTTLLYPNLYNYIPTNFLDIYYNIKDIEIDKKIEICKKLSINDSIRYNDNLLKDYIYFIFNKYFKISKSQYNITMLDIFNENICKKKVAFSGSTNINLPLEITKSFCDNLNQLPVSGIMPKQLLLINYNLFKEIIYDTVTKGSIISSLYGITRNNKLLNNIILYSTKDKTKKQIEDIFIQRILREDTLKKYSAVIDTAGLIINTISIDLATKIFNKFIELKNKGKITYIKNILYVNNHGERIIFNINNIIVNQKYNNEKYENCFIIYDNKHTVGIDFKQPPNMIGLISISKINNLTQVSQGIYRLRNINYGHFVDFYTDEDIVKDIPILKPPDFDICRLETIISRLTQNDIYYKNNAESYMKIQSLKYINRNMNNMNKDTFIEEVFYDLITYDGNFLKINEFEDREILKIQQNLLKIQVRIIPFKTSKSIIISTNLAVNVEQQIEQQIEQQVEINYKQELSSLNNKDYIINLPEDCINIDNINENNNKIFINRINNFNYLNLQIFDWIINFSSLYIYFIQLTTTRPKYYRDTFLNFQVDDLDYFFGRVISPMRINMTIPYFLYDINKPKTLTLITFIDMIQINKQYYQSKKNNNIPNKYNNIIIFDKFYNIILNHGNNNVELPNFILLLFFKVKLNIYQQYKLLQKITNIPAGTNNLSGYDLIKFINYDLYFDYDFTVESIIYGPITFNEKIYDSWYYSLYLPRINDARLLAQFKKIINEKYIITNENDKPIKYDINTSINSELVYNLVLHPDILRIRDIYNQFLQKNIVKDLIENYNNEFSNLLTDINISDVSIEEINSFETDSQKIIDNNIYYSSIKIFLLLKINQQKNNYKKILTNINKLNNNIDQGILDQLFKDINQLNKPKKNIDITNLKNKVNESYTNKNNIKEFMIKIGVENILKIINLKNIYDDFNNLLIINNIDPNRYFTEYNKIKDTFDKLEYIYKAYNTNQNINFIYKLLLINLIIINNTKIKINEFIDIYNKIDNNYDIYNLNYSTLYNFRNNTGPTDLGQYADILNKINNYNITFDKIKLKLDEIGESDRIKLDINVEDFEKDFNDKVQGFKDEILKPAFNKDETLIEINKIDIILGELKIKLDYTEDLFKNINSVINYIDSIENSENFRRLSQMCVFINKQEDCIFDLNKSKEKLIFIINNKTSIYKIYEYIENNYKLTDIQCYIKQLKLQNIINDKEKILDNRLLIELDSLKNICIDDFLKRRDELSEIFNKYKIIYNHNIRLKTNLIPLLSKSSCIIC